MRDFVVLNFDDVIYFEIIDIWYRVLTKSFEIILIWLMIELFIV